MLVVGIDPGLSGAVCMMLPDYGIADLIDMPTFVLPRGGKSKREIDAHALAQFLSKHPGVAHVFVEQVGAMPGQGVSGMFAFGKSYGIVIGILAALDLPMTLVSSRRWKSNLGVPALKDGARARASQLMPSGAKWWPLKKHDGRAESALIAMYGLRSCTKTDTIQLPQAEVKKIAAGADPEDVRIKFRRGNADA